MNRGKPEQIVKLLRKADEELAKGKLVEDFCREKQISPTTYYRWQRRTLVLPLFPRDSPGKTASSKVFMTISALKVSNANGSPPYSMFEWSLKIGDCTIIPSDRIVHPSTKPRQNLPPNSNLLRLSFPLDTKTEAGHRF